jgi:hypothetical protein
LRLISYHNNAARSKRKEERFVDSFCELKLYKFVAPLSCYSWLCWWDDSRLKYYIVSVFNVTEK